MVKVKIKGLATGIGSLPHKDADAALDLIFKYCPQIPFWPQLPKRDTREGMVAQFSEGLTFSGADKEKELEKFYGRLIANDVDYFQISPDYSLGLHKFYQRLKSQSLEGIEFIKCQVTGPFTFAASIKNEEGVSLLHDSVFMQALLKGLGMKALWQLKLFREFGKKIILFFDEPYLGCFGSSYTPINREEVVKGLSELNAQIKSQDVLLGVHCCGNTDWSIFTETENLDIINFDAFGFLDRLVLYADELKKFFKRGGILCWGIVPTQELVASEAKDLLLKKIKDGIAVLVKKGLDRDLLLENLLISPSCGMGTLSEKEAGLVLKLVSQLSEELREFT